MKDQHIIDKPGVYDLPERVYLSDPVESGSISSSTARSMLRPGGPARVKWEKDHPVIKDHFDRGSVFHALVLGKGSEIAEIDAPSWQTKDAREQRDHYRSEGKTPILSKDLLSCKAMARKVMTHSKVRELGLFTAGQGVAEQSVFWQDDEFGVMRRAMIDWWAPELIVDLKTTADASPEAVAKSVYSFGYDQQDCWYRDAVRSVSGENLPMIFVFVEKEAPYFVSVIELDDAFLDRGERRNRVGIKKWVECRKSSIWPGYSNEIQTISPPRWAQYETDVEEL